MSDLSNTELFAKLRSAISASAETVTNNLKTHIAVENQKLLDKLSEQSLKVSELEAKCSAYEKQIINFERKFRKNNLIIYGLICSEERGLIECVIELFKNSLQLDVCESDFNDIYPLAAQKSPSTPPIKIELISHIKKQRILKNCKKLKGSKIFISEDLCLEDRKDKKILVHHMKLARDKRLSAKLLSGNRVQINGQVYTAAQLESSEEFAVFQQKDLSPVAIRPNSAPSTPTLVSRELLHEEDPNNLCKNGDKRKRDEIVVPDAPTTPSSLGKTKKSKAGPTVSLRSAKTKF